MKTKMNCMLLLLILTITVTVPSSYGQDHENRLSELVFTLPADELRAIKVLNYDFVGYTTHWDRYAWKWNSYCGLFLTSQPEIESEIQKMEMDIGNQLLLDELWIQNGFIYQLAKTSFLLLRSPSQEELEKQLSLGNVFLLAVDRDPVMKEILAKLPEELQFRRNRAFYLQYGERTLFTIASHTHEEMERLYNHIKNAKGIIERYFLYKGLAGVHTNYLLITPSYRHNPYTLINTALQIGCSWIMVSGYNDWMLPEIVNNSLGDIHFPFVFLPGQYGTGGVMYGMEQYPNIQDNTIEQCLDWTEKNKGYYFAYLSGTWDKHTDRCSGYIVNSPANQVKMDSLKAPFITNAGTINTNAPPTMVLFLDKKDELNERNIMRAILDKRAVAVFDKGSMLGAKELRDLLRILLLENEYLEKQFLSHLSVDAHIKDNELNATIQNRTNETLNADLLFQSSQNLIIGKNVQKMPISLSAYENRNLSFPITCTAGASGKDNPIGVVLNTPSGKVRALTHFEVPSAVEIHPLILDVPGNVTYPVTIWNYTKQKNVAAKLEVFTVNGKKRVFVDQISLDVPRWHKTISHFEIPLQAGEYIAKVSALGVTTEGEISIKSQTGHATVHEEDMNDDGIPEIVMENSKICATILLFGGRVIEYIVKSRNENLLFKLWPQKPPWAGEPRGVRAFYPYGGLEEFIGYPYIGGHIVFKYEIQQQSGNYVRVRLWANIHGSKIEKTITLFGDSEALEVRYALNDMVANIHVIGINPLIEIGPSTGPEDVYYFPAEKLEKRSPVLERYYGDIFFLKEGWAAGYDTEMDISLIVGYPVNDAMFMHLWNNHPNNTPTPYFYTELQPWLKIKHRTTTYFSYYLFGQDGDWKAVLENFKQLGLITKKKNLSD